MTPLIEKAQNQELQMDDLYPLRKCDKPSKFSKKFVDNYNNISKAKKPRFGNAFYATIVSTYLPTFLICMIPRFLARLLIFLNPLLLIKLVDTIQFGKDRAIKDCYFWVLVYIACEIFRAILWNIYHNLVLKFHIKFRSSITLLIYRKCLVMSQQINLINEEKNAKEKDQKKKNEKKKKLKKNANKREVREKNKSKKEDDDDDKYNNLSHLVSRISSDTRKLSQSVLSLHSLFFRPLQVTLALTFLIKTLGWIPGLFSFFLITTAMGVNKLMMDKLSLMHKAKKKITEKRIELVNDLIHSIKLIKLNAWDNVWKNKINKVRNEEIEQIRKSKSFGVYLKMIWVCLPVFMSIGTFFLYISLGNKLNWKVVFSSLGFLKQLKNPMLRFPKAIKCFIDIQISSQRINDFLVNSKKSLIR
eukprot:Anaeramoba_flamelloidesc33890_g1_i1.p2 GENE.c33890_g1_i1~~c33890_g1_i1.p2  ORF type:complete len:445 (-),score=109.71 c33890_g1_i1:1286-2533(-)